MPRNDKSETLSRFGYATLCDALVGTAKNFGEQTIVHVSPVDASEDVQNYRKLEQDARGLARLLVSKGWRKGQTMVFVVTGSRHFVTCFWGALLAGIIPVPLAPLMNKDLDSMEAEKIRNVSGIVDAPVLIDSRTHDYAKLLKDIVDAVGGQLIYADELIREADLGHFEDADLPVIASDDIVVLQFSSGSSGLPKGVRLTHRNIIANIEGQIDCSGVGKDDVMCTWLPYFHDLGLFWGHLSTLYMGMKQVRIDPGHFARRPFLWLEKMSHHGATVTNSTPTALNHLITCLERKQNRGIPSYDLTRLRSLVIGAEMIDPADCRRAIEQLAPFGVKDTLFQTGYGLTETTVVATIVRPDTPLRTRVLDRKVLAESGRVLDVPAGHADAAEFTSVGPAVKHCEIRIVDDEGQVLGVDEIGVIEIRGDNVAGGYFENEEADRKAYKNGWFDSGDVGFVDADGFLTITGRAKEMVIVGGHNHYPWDIERLALTAPGAADAVRFATVCSQFVPELHREEIILFFVPERISEEAVQAGLAAMRKHVNAIAGFPIDSFVRLQMRDIPRTSSGKVMRRMLLQNLAQGLSQRVDLGDAKADAAPARGKRRSAGDVRELLLTLWSEALDMPRGEIPANANLFNLGCNSLRSGQIQGRLEEALGQRLETNFNYLHPVLDDQVAQLVARDPSLVSPGSEVELILRTVAHEVLGLPEHEIGVTQPLSTLTKGLTQAVKLHAEIVRVFDLSPDDAERLQGGTIQALSADITKVTGIGAQGRKGVRFPLMNFQETLYFHRKGFVRNEPSKLSCFIFIRLDLKVAGGEPIDPARLSQAFDRVIRRHPMLRAVVDESRERPHLHVLDDVPPFRVDFGKLEGDEEAIEDVLATRGRDLNDVRFDMGAWPLFLGELYERPDGDYHFLFNIDHLLIDGFSFMHLLREIFASYDAAADGEPEKPRTAGLSFGDYVRIEQARQRTHSYQRAMDYQLSLFQNLPPKAMLPFKTDPAAIEDVWFDTHYHMVDPCQMSRLATVAARNGLTLNSLLLAAWFKIVNLWSGQDDLIINMPVFNREQYFPAARSVIGTFIDIFPVRVGTNPSESVVEIARKVERFTRELLSTPVSSIELSRLIAQRDRTSSGSMSSLIFSNSIGVYGGEWDGLKKVRIKNPLFRTGAPGTFIDLVLYDFEGRYFVNWNYIRDLMDREFVETLAGQFQDLCRDLADSETPSGGFDATRLLPSAFKAVIESNNATETSVPQDTIQGLVRRQAERTPYAVAVTDGNGVSLTYGELLARANKVGHLLRELKVGRGQFVAILFERGIDMLVAQLGVLQAGAAYVPIDPDYPRERLAYVIDDCQARLLLTQGHLVGRVPAAPGNLETVVVVDGPAPKDTARRVVGAESLANRPETAPDRPGTPDDLAYMIYTSGSTGHPKGVMIPHRGIVNFLLWVRTFHDLGPDDDVALVTSYAFDMTLATNWTPLMCGAHIHVLHERETRDVETLLRFISERQVSFLNVTPSHFSLLSSAREHLDLGDLPMMPTMQVMLGGEVINTKDLELWLRHYPGHRFVNEYGPTEVSVATTAFPIPVDAKGRITMPVIPIGKPLQNCTAYVLDRCGNPCLPGVAGELCLGGVGVALGYFNKPEKTAAAFVLDPFVEGQTMYRTGDLARIWPDGNIEFLGRRDYQINLRGYRIEAGEVEAALTEHPAVSQAVVLAHLDDAGQNQLVAYFVGTAEATTAELKAFLADRLPAHMVPVQTMRLDTLPVTPSGKLDRKALPAMRGISGRSGLLLKKPAGETERLIARIWCKLLGLDEVGTDEDFWDLGGDSLRAMRLIVSYREAGLPAFGLRDVFTYNTIGGTAAFFDDGTEDQGGELLAVIKSCDAPKARLLLLPFACGNASSFISLSRLLPDDVEVVALSPNPAWTSGRASIPNMAAEVIRAMPGQWWMSEPLYIAGYSFGGVLACEIAAMLEEHCHGAKGVAIIASTPPRVTGEFEVILKAPDDEILAYSRKVYGFDQDTLSASETERYLKDLRAQTSAMAAYDFSRSQRLETPAVIVLGEAEEDAELIRYRYRWSEVFNRCRHETLPGGHMLIKANPGDLAASLSAFIDEIETGELSARADLL